LRGALAACLPLLLLSLAVGCSSHTQVRKKFMGQVQQGQYEKAEQTLSRIGGKSKVDLLVDLMDRAMVLHRLGRFERSNHFLEMANAKIDEYYTQKFSDKLKALAWNDSSATYQGEDYERTMVDILQAFNYLGLGQLDAALVEARQVNHKLGIFVEKLKALRVRTGYTSDPFANYLAGLIHEAGGNHDSAYLSYSRAHKDYESLGSAYGVRSPALLGGDLIRTARRAGRHDDAQRWSARFPSYDALVEDDMIASTEIVVIVGLGLVAHKVSRKWIQHHGTDSVIVTYPEYVPTPTRAQAADVSIDAAMRSPLQVVHDLTTIAVGVMHERNEAVKDKALAEAVVRFVARQATRAVANQYKDNSNVQLASALFTVFSKVKEAVETADTRSWQTLPDRYAVARFRVSPGAHEVVVRFLDRSGSEIRRESRAVFVAQNTKSFVVVHSADAPVRNPTKRTKKH
jgi:hypothetical protein